MLAVHGVLSAAPPAVGMHWPAQASFARHVRAVCAAWLYGKRPALHGQHGQFSFAADQRATDTHHAWRREQQRCALHLPVFDFIGIRVADHPLVNSIVLTCAVGSKAIATSTSARWTSLWYCVGIVLMCSVGSMHLHTME
jgi:hypothetical protein